MPLLGLVEAVRPEWVLGWSQIFQPAEPLEAAHWRESDQREFHSAIDPQFAHGLSEQAVSSISLKESGEPEYAS
jgi:hypothetical protein